MRSYTALRMWKQQFIIRTQEDLMNLDNIKKCNQKLWAKSVKHECYNKWLIKSHIQWVETYKCYNCDKLKYLIRDCKKP